ncbi:unnamed protein product [Rotaria sp. Silwood1]|nr:unnamed protein product [Rotaria sp. Silwood1]
MANNVVVETHYTQNMNRSLAADSETYQQCNYQTFQMLVLSVVDPLNTDEVRLKHLHNIAENIEILSTLPNYAVYIDLLVKNLLRSLIETDTVFIIPSNAQTIRKQMIEIFHRLPITEALRGFVKDILSPMFKLLTKENEENALLLLRIIVEYMKQFRPQMIMEVREFLQFVHNVYRQKASALDQIFLTKTFSHPTITINEIDLSTIIEQICTSVKLIVKKIQNFPVQSSITTDETTNSTPHIVTDTFTILSRASHSVKLLAEFPVAIVLLYQLCRQSLQAEFGELVPLFLRYLTLQPSKEQKNDPKFNMEIYIEFLTTQAKTLSFLAFVGKTYQEQLALNSDLLVLAIFQLLDGCPPENVQLRKDIIVAARHFVSSDFRTLFIPHVKRFFDENLLLSTGYTARETLKPLAYNTFGEFFNHIRTNLSIEDLQNVLYMYSKMIHDSSLPPTIQVTSLKFLTNIAESIRQKGSEKSRDLLIHVIETLVFKCKSLAKQYTHLSTNSNEKTNSSTIPSVNEVDVTTSTLNELVQNMNDITNREKELQRQQLSLIRFQATSPLIYTLSSNDCRTLLKVLVSSLRHITWILADVKISENLVSQPKQFSPSITILYIKFFKYILQCLIIFFDSTSTINSNGNSSTINNTNNVTRNKEEKEIMDMIASVFIVMHKQNYREIFENNLLYFYQCANKNPNITLIMNTLLQQSPSSTILVELLLEFLLPRINEIGETNNTNNACLKLFKLVINSVVTTTLANENEKILQPYLKQIILRSIECAQLTQDPYNYFILLRALFRSIGVGNHELLNQEFLTLLHFLLQRLNEYQSCKHRQNLRELFIELCLTVPVRLSVLLPYLPLLMEPLVNALNGSSTLILQGLRTLELCVDNLQPDFLYNHILPVRSSLMISLYRLLSHSNNDIAQNTFRILGKLGGNNRRILNEPQQIKYDNEEFDIEQQNEIYVQIIGTVIPSVPVVDSYQKIKQIIKCYLVLFPTLSSNDIQDIFDIIEQANTKYFNKDMMSEFYSLKAVAYSKLNRNDEAQKLFSCATQLSDTNLTRIWINWGDFLLKQSSIINDDESIIICYLNACKDLTEIKARSILSKIFYLLSHDNENNNNNKLSICIERYLSLIPVQHWLFWLPQIMNKLIRNESSQCMLAILNELIRLYPQAVYVQIKKFLRKLIENKHDEKLIPSTPITPTIDINLNLPTISYRQQAINNLNRLEQILLGQHPTIVRILDIIIEQLNTINETLFEYIIKRLYQCQRKIYEDLFENKKDLSEDVKQIIQHLKDILNNDNNEYKNIQPIKIQFSNDFNESVLNTTQISRSFILLINKWITLIERRIEQTEPRIKYLNQIKYLQLLSFNSQITNDINMPGELWHAPEANFYFRINKFFPTIERIFKHERYFNRLTIRAHNGKIMYYLLSNNYQTISYDKINSQWELEENTLQFLKMINNICIRKEKELLKRHMQIFLPHLCTYLPSLRLIEDNRLTINLIEIYNNRLMLPIRKYYELIDDNNDNLLNIYQLIQNEFFSNKYLLHQWTLNEYTNATGYFSFRKIFTISMSFYSTLNYLFGFYMYTNNQLSIQRSIGNINPLYLRLQYNLNKQDENIFLTPNIDTFINRFGKMGSFIATILATLTSLAQPKFQIIEYLKIFYKEDIHIKHPELTQKECVELVENIARQLETKLNQFTDIDISKRIVSELVENSTDINQLSRLNPLYYPWL